MFPSRFVLSCTSSLLIRSLATSNKNVHVFFRSAPLEVALSHFAASERIYIEMQAADLSGTIHQLLVTGLKRARTQKCHGLNECQIFEELEAAVMSYMKDEA